MYNWNIDCDPKELGVIAVIYGGWSSERSVSLESGVCLINACKRLGVDVLGFDIRSPEDLLQLDFSKVQGCLIALHGGDGEDGHVQSVLDLMQLPYVGSGVLASALCMNKVSSRLICKSVGVPVVPWQDFSYDQPPYQPEFSFPICLKPVSGGSSIGVSKVNSIEDWLVLRDTLSEGQWMLEPWFSGVDHFAGVLRGVVLPILELALPQGQFFDYNHKYSSTNTAYRAVQKDNISEWMLASYQALGCKHYARADFITIGDRSWFLEMNTLPGLSPICLVPRQAKLAGLNYDKLVMVLLHSLVEELACV